MANNDTDDIIDEVLYFFRANVLFRNFMIEGGADRTLIYLTLHAVQCLVKLEKIDDKNTAMRELRSLSRDKAFAAPGENGFVLGSLFGAPGNRGDVDSWKAYMKQAREELAIRLVEKVFDEKFEGGKKNKWWQAFSKRKFMGKELKD
jgi:actin related protein 2/3 complex subunit 3